MDKSNVQTQENIPIRLTDNREKSPPLGSDPQIIKKRPHVKPDRKIVLIFVVVLIVATAFVSSVLYYRKNFTPDTIVRKAVANLIKQRDVTYNATTKLTFQYADTEEKINLNGLEAYSLLKKTVANNHEMVMQGEHTWSSEVPSGKYDLIWSVSDKKVFGLEGHYQGYQVFYKVNPYVYSDLVDEKLTKNYSSVDLKELVSKIVSDEDLKSLEEFRMENLDFDVVQVFQDDFIKGNKAYHYKVKLLGKGSAEKIINGIKNDNFDFWIDKKSLDIEKVKGNFTLVNIGVEGNNLDIQFDLILGI
jgi:hypothetical protein